jgi:hypothetical protein
MTIASRLGIPAPELPEQSPLLVCSGTYIGVEIEVEGVSSSSTRPFNNHELWTHCSDGSLRNSGREFKFGRPLAGTSVVDAVNFFYANWGISWEATARCGLHVHIDVRDLTDKGFAMMQLYSLAVDEWLFNEYESSWRCGAPFCRLSSGNLNVLRAVNNNIHGAWNQTELDTRRMAWGVDARDNSLKYHSVNFSFNNFGTVEFRHFQVQDTAEKLLAIINTLIKVKKLAKQAANSIPDVQSALVTSSHAAFIAEFPSCESELAVMLCKVSASN